MQKCTCYYIKNLFSYEYRCNDIYRIIGNIKFGEVFMINRNHDREHRATLLPNGVKRNGTRGGTIMMIMLMIVTMVAYRPC